MSYESYEGSNFLSMGCPDLSQTQSAFFIYFLILSINEISRAAVIHREIPAGSQVVFTVTMCSYIPTDYCPSHLNPQHLNTPHTEHVYKYDSFGEN